ncbi:MAG TPA: hypothetical protein VF712_07635 [Thermoleophilaceae bacterium]|jgi:hypothetical protein
MKRSLSMLPLVLAAVLAVAAPASAAPSRDVVADDLGLPLRGWAVIGRPGLRQVRVDVRNPYAIDGRSLSLTGGGSIARPMPPRPWSLSLDVRLARRAILRIHLGGEPLMLAQRSDGTLTVRSGDASARLPRATAPGGWRHVEVAGFDPVEIHVDGTRIPHEVTQASGIELRTLRRTAQVTGLVATRRDDRRALLLHRLASIHSRTPARRYPVGTGADGVLRFESGRDDGFYAGALWDAYGVTGARLFRDWGERATFDHMFRTRSEVPPVHWEGLRFYESSAQADERTCHPTRPEHRCRLFRKSTTSTPLYGLWVLNSGTGTIPTVLWPGRCPSCASADEVETRVETMLDVALFEWNHRLAENSRRANPGIRADESPLEDAALRHADGVARLLVRADGSTAESVRTSRLDGTVLSYEHSSAAGSDTTWARGHAAALYGFARMGRRFGERGLVATGERLARYLDANLPASRVPPHDYSAPAGPADPDAGALYAAGLLRLADACARLDGACDDGPRWRSLGVAMLDAWLGRLAAHPPIGSSPEGETLLGIDYALEAIERSAG